MKIRFQIIILFAMLISSCQKELSLESNGSNNGGGGGGSTTGDLLIKVAGKNGNDSAVAIYTYDASNRVIRFETINAMASTNTNSAKIFERNATSGLITSFKQVTSSSLFGGTPDTAKYDVRYDMAPAVPRISNIVGFTSFLGLTLADSTTLEYDAKGRIVKESEYSESLFGGSMELSSTTEYSYDQNGNIISAKNYSYSSGVKELDLETIYSSYDTKVNPFRTISVADAYLIGGAGTNSPNNVLRSVTKSYPAPGASPIDQTNVFSYQYRTDGKPSSSSVIISSSVSPSTKYQYTMTYK